MQHRRQAGRGHSQDGGLHPQAVGGSLNRRYLMARGVDMKVKRTVGIALLGIGAVISVFFDFSMGHPTALSAAVSEARLDDLPLLGVIPLQAELGHVQGIATDGRRLWVTDRPRAP